MGMLAVEKERKNFLECISTNVYVYRIEIFDDEKNIIISMKCSS